ncbi:MAG: response regulator [Synergistaceae bacterium]|nr:response regulator [Synergistaceae bacterium]
MTAINNFSEVWLEITMLPFLTVLVIFLGGRMATTMEINKRFLLLVVSTLASAFIEVILELFTDMETITIYTKIFYALVNINAYSLMCYVAAYTRSIDERLVNVNFFMLSLSLILLFMFRSDEKIFMVFAPGFAIIFVLEGFILQLIYQKYYGNGQFIVMNFLFILLIDSFLLQYLFRQNIPLVYTVATMMLFFTFFYLEAPTYRQLISAQHETENARIQTEESIQRANIANKAKSNFLASTSHEIRTPMNAILGINDMILEELKDSGDNETRKASNDIKKAGEYLLQLVNNILDISKIEAGKMELYENSYHLWEMLKECEVFVNDKLKGKSGIKFILEVDRNLPENLFGDVLRLKQLLINLLDNAEKYTVRGSISLKVSGEMITDNILKLVFTVSDTGIGMKEEDLKTIFEPFERANLIETRSILGAGLGLTLVRSILEIMSGTISINSKYGEGTSITVEIPQKISRGKNITIGEYEEEMLNAAANIPALTESHDDGPDVWPDAKILVVDDTPVNLVVAKGMLKNSEAEIETCESGEEALDMMKKTHYDVVFLDHMMPGLNGIETLKKAKKNADGTKFVALTANAGVNARAEYLSYGFDDYLPKPFKGAEMMRVLKECLNKKK